MAHSPLRRFDVAQFVPPLHQNPKPAPQEARGDIETRTVETVVVAVIPEFRQVEVKGDDGRFYAITRHTRGTGPVGLREGQRLLCTVTVRFPKVLFAALLA